MGLLKKILFYIIENKWLLLLNGNKIRISRNSSFSYNKSSMIRGCTIHLSNNSKLILHDNVRIKNVNIFVDNGFVEIGEHSIISKDTNYTKPSYIINNGSLTIGNHSKISPIRIWIRFGGKLEIGNYTNINALSEIRSDENIIIGSYCQISYNVNIWDTNTHGIYPPVERRIIAEKYFPYFGYERIKPKTSPISIGDFCWLGKRSTILKGCNIGHNVIIGYNTTLTSCSIENDKTVVSEIKNKIIG